MPKWARSLGLAALLLAGVAYYAIHGYKQPESGVHSSGVIEGTEVNLAPKVSGRISEICCNEGDRIQSNQIVIRLESADLTAAVEQAQGGVERAQANIGVAESSIRFARASIESAAAGINTVQADTVKTKAQMDDADRKLARMRALFQQKFISQDALDTATTTHAAAEADFASAKSKLVEAQFKRDAAVAQLSSAQNQLQLDHSELKQSQANLAYSQAKLADTVITSPISGTVVFKALEKGETVSPGITVLTVVDLASLYARVDVDESLLDKIALGSEVTISTAGSPGKQLKGKVAEIGQYAGFATQRDVTRGRQDIKTFRVKIALEDPAALLKPGMTVDVEMANKKAEP